MNIKEVSQTLHLSAESIRYYEKEKLITIARNTSGYRDFSEENIERLHFLKKMREAGVGIKALKSYCSLLDDNKNHDIEQKMLLIKEREIARAKIAKMQEALDYLDWKIEGYYRRVKVLGDKSE